MYNCNTGMGVAPPTRPHLLHLTLVCLTLDLRSGGASAFRDLNRGPDDADTEEDARVADDSAPPISTHVLREGNPEHYRLQLALLAYLKEEYCRDGIIIPNRNMWNDDFDC